jgi:hypothetical protein
MNAGFAQADIDILQEFLNDKVDGIKSLEEFIGGFTHAVTMIAMGYPELIDPKPSVFFMM